MANIPNKVEDRLTAGIKKFQGILNNAKAKDVNESDTVLIITDMLSEIFGYDKYSEITTEYVVQKTYCDLAIKIDGKPRFLIEAKAIGLNLKEDHVRQAVDYGAKEGIEWVILTNGIIWQIYKIIFGKPIEKELVFDFDFATLSHKNKEHLEELYYVSKEGIGKSVLEEFHIQKQALSKFFIAQILLSETILDVINREVRRVSPGVKIENSQIENVLLMDVMKREVVEGDRADEAKKKIKKAQNVSLRDTKPKKPDSKPEAEPKTETDKTE